ncbi:MAG TPA: DinB family protein [Terriglobales bacterium]|nr:DinB family protein [Terriglobales bacterium]
MEAISQLRKLLQVVPGRLAAFTTGKAERKPDPSHWSPKEELGHLLDSAVNNHQRIVRAQMEDNIALPGYAQNRWVAIHGYQERDWQELISLWSAINRQLLRAAESVPDSAWSNMLRVGGSEPMTLEFVFDDYVAHMVHHLKHIGIELDDVPIRDWKAA